VKGIEVYIFFLYVLDCNFGAWQRIVAVRDPDKKAVTKFGLVDAG